MSRISGGDPNLTLHLGENADQPTHAPGVQLAGEIIEEEQGGVVAVSGCEELGELEGQHDGAGLALRGIVAGQPPIEEDREIVAMGPHKNPLLPPLFGPGSRDDLRQGSPTRSGDPHPAQLEIHGLIPSDLLDHLLERFPQLIDHLLALLGKTHPQIDQPLIPDIQLDIARWPPKQHRFLAHDPLVGAHQVEIGRRGGEASPIDKSAPLIGAATNNRCMLGAEQNGSDRTKPLLKSTDGAIIEEELPPGRPV
ncbi:MAG: hypothetical protein P8R54_28665 [Myxococcota bacterium]|nr:hypothetical protein [Myxococcota bacterium]